MNLPPDEIMRHMAKMAMEQATTYFAAQAREFAKTVPPDATGKDVLEAFAKAIENTNVKVWPNQKART